MVSGPGKPLLMQIERQCTPHFTPHRTPQCTPHSVLLGNFYSLTSISGKVKSYLAFHRSVMLGQSIQLT